MSYKISKQKKIELEEELKYLETIERARINELMSGSKWTESTRKYAAAVMEKNIFEANLKRIREILKKCVVIDPQKVDKSKVGVGVNVELRSNEKALNFKIVSSVETDPSKNMISLESPAGRALKDKKAGDKVILPNGEIFQIDKIT